MVVKKICILLLLSGCLSSVCWGQLYSTETSREERKMICVWESAPLLITPENSSAAVTTIYFGEIVKTIGNPAFVKEEQAVYQHVQAADGKSGWIQEKLLIPNGRAVTVLEASRIYLRPRTVSTITDEFFEAGDLVIMSAAHADWVKLTGKSRKKAGWIKGRDHISASKEDIQVVALMEAALREKDILKRKEKLKALSENPAISNNSLREVVVEKSEKSTEEMDNLPLMGESDLQRTRGGAVWDSSLDVLLPATSTSVNSELYRKSITNPLTRETIEYIVETGSVFKVEAPAHVETIYFAYHKTLPVGTRVQLDIPDNAGFLELKIVGRLPSDKHQIIGLSKTCMETVFGTDSPKSATISYKKKQ